MADTEQQMEMMLEGGGMAADGRDVDPVSGNAIPPGSSAEEVRDDVPVNISEGEYIIPADVVQFMGVDKLEKMVFKAKQELQKMEKAGRMGEVEGEDDLPIADEELEVLEEEGEKNFNQGGLSGSAFDFDQYSFGGPADLGGFGGTENRIYVNAQGERRPILFINGKPQSPIPDGFVPDTPEGKSAFEKSTAEDTTSDLYTDIETGTQNNQEKERTPNERTKRDYSSLSNEDIKDFAERSNLRDTKSKAIGLGTGMVNPVAGAVAAVASRVNEANKAIDMISEAQSRLSKAKDPEERSMLESSIKALEDSLSPFQEMVTGRKSLMESLGFAPKDKPNTVKAPDSVMRQAQKALGSTSTGGGSRPSAAPATSARPKSRPDGLGARSKSSSSSGPSSSSSSSGSSRGESRSGGGTYGRAEGGLVAKRDKKKNYRSGGLVKK